MLCWCLSLLSLRLHQGVLEGFPRRECLLFYGERIISCYYSAAAKVVQMAMQQDELLGSLRSLSK